MPFRILHKIHELGCRTVLFWNQNAPPASYIRHYLHCPDKILYECPGFASSGFYSRNTGIRPKEAKAPGTTWLSVSNQVDGSVMTTFSELRQAGVEVFIVGNSVCFQLDDNLHAAWGKMLCSFMEIDKTQHLRKRL